MKCKRNVARVLCVLMIFSIAIVTVFGFLTQLQRALTRETYRTLSEVSQDYNKAFLDRITYNIRTMNVVAGDLMAVHRSLTKEEVMHILQNAVDGGGFTKMAICDTSGMSYSNRGMSADVSKRAYFQKAMKGESNVSQPLASLVNGEESIVIAVPIQSKDGIVGVLMGVYPLATAGTQLLDFTYYSEGYGFVVSPDGSIVLSSQHVDKLANEKNLFSFFEKTNFVDFSLEKLKAAMAKGESRSFTFTYNGERRFVSFVPSTVNDWYTFSIASDAMMLQQEKTTNGMVLQLILGLMLAGILIVAWIVMGSRHHNKEVRAANQKYQSLLSHINGGMVVAIHAKVAEETIATYVSSVFTDMTGYTLEDIRSIHQGRYLDIVFEEDREAAFEKFLEQLKIGNTYRLPYRIRKKDGSILWVMDNGYLVEGTDGLHNHSILTDITIIKKQEEELRMSENRFSVAINASSGTLFEVDLKKQLYTHFENSQRIFGVDAKQLLEDTSRFASLPFDEFVDAVTGYFFHPEDHGMVNRAMQGLLTEGKASYEARLRRFDNRYIWAKIDLSLSLDEFGEPLRLVGFMSDIDDIKRQAELLENKVQTDPMTDLYNKVAMVTLANKVIHERPCGLHGLIILDIDNFKGINDTLGHAFGDLVLIEACSKLKALFRSNDIVGRMGGDEFAVLMKNVPDASSVLKKATELSSIFRQTYTGEKGDYKISCSMGILMIESNVDSFEVLYRKADAALYRAKQRGKDQFVLYQEEDADSYPIETTRTNDEELQNLKSSHDIEVHIFELMYTSKDFNVSINMALAAIGQQYHVSRVAIFENDEENCVTNNIYEWCNTGVAAEMDHLQKLQLSSGSESILDSFDSKGLLYCQDIRELPPYIRQILEPQGILSTLKVTIINDEKICGFIGFDECNEYRVWTSEEVEKLSFLSKVLSVFLFKKKTEDTLFENLHTRLKILDVLPDYICVVNPETHALVYANMRMQELLPDVQAGTFCYTTLRGGQEGPCETCLVERIKRGDTENLEIISKDQNLHLKVKALFINWANNKRMVLLYGFPKK